MLKNRWSIQVAGFFRKPVGIDDFITSDIIKNEELPFVKFVSRIVHRDRQFGQPHIRKMFITKPIILFGLF